MREFGPTLFLITDDLLESSLEALCFNIIITGGSSFMTVISMKYYRLVVIRWKHMYELQGCLS